VLGFFLRKNRRMDMTSVEFTGLDGKKYLIPQLHDFADQSELKLPKIKTNSSDVDIIGHVMLIVASQPGYINKSDTPWLLAHLLELRNFASGIDRGSITYHHLNALNRFDDLLSVLRSIFALEFVMSHANGFYLKERQHKILETPDEFCQRISEIDRRAKSILTSEYFKGAIYKCRVPDNSLVTLAAPSGQILRAGDEFLMIQERFHGSENFYSPSPNVDVQNPHQDECNFYEFSVPGKILQPLTTKTAYGRDYCTRNVAEIPCSWIQASGWKIESLKAAIALESFDDAEVIDLGSEASFASSIHISQYDRLIEVAKSELFAIDRLGMTDELFGYLVANHDVIDLQNEAKKLRQMIEQKLKISIPKKKALVSRHPILFNMFDECSRSVQWLIFRGKVTNEIIHSMALSKQNFSKEEATEFYSKSESLYPYPFKIIPVEHHSKSELMCLLPRLSEEDFQFIDWKSITEDDLNSYYGDELESSLQWTPAAKILGHILPADIDLEMPDDYRRRLISC
jgi:hypothetical protein